MARVLPDTALQSLIESGAIRSDTPIVASQVQPSSLDLRLSARVWRVRASFLPNKTETVQERLDALALHAFSLENGAVLETGCVYVAELQESLTLPPTLRAMANPKSSTGRIDVFTRVLGDGADVFDTLPDGFRGKLYLEISPRTFPILVCASASASA